MAHVCTFPSWMASISADSFSKFDLKDTFSYWSPFSVSVDTIIKPLASNQNRLAFLPSASLTWMQLIFPSSSWASSAERGPLPIHQVIQFYWMCGLEEWESLWCSNRKGKGCDGERSDASRVKVKDNFCSPQVGILHSPQVSFGCFFSVERNM